MRGRALTLEDKKAVLDHILKAWVAVPELRLGQLVENALGTRLELLPDLFYIEDEPLANCVEAYVASRTVAPTLEKPEP